MPGYCYIENVSEDFTLVATLRIPGNKARTLIVPPKKKLPLVGSTVLWDLWTLRWRKPIPKDFKDWVNG